MVSQWLTIPGSFSGSGLIPAGNNGQAAVVFAEVEENVVELRWAAVSHCCNNDERGAQK